MTFMNKVKNFFFTTLIGGIVVILPITIIILLINFLFGIINNLLAPLINLLDLSNRLDGLVVNIIAFAILIAFCFILGLIVRTRFGKNFLGYIEREWLAKLPLYNVIKETVQQFTGAKKMPFKQVVSVDPFGTGTRMTGFITDEHDNGIVTVFVPTAPNPTNGFVFHMAEDLVIRVNADTEDALRTIIGVGVGSKDVLQVIEKEQVEN